MPQCFFDGDARVAFEHRIRLLDSPVIVLIAFFNQVTVLESSSRGNNRSRVALVPAAIIRAGFVAPEISFKGGGKNFSQARQAFVC
jgi:hypothetical protein